MNRSRSVKRSVAPYRRVTTSFALVRWPIIRHYQRFLSTKSSSDKSEKPYVNPVGIQYLSNSLHKKLFPGISRSGEVSPQQKRLIDLSKQYLRAHDLLGKNTSITDPINFSLPDLEGKDLDEHFRRIALFASNPYLEYAHKLADLKALPKQPDTWLFKSGWYKYPADGSEPLKVDFPDENSLVFDVETLYKVSNYPVLATALSENGWYGWISPVLTGESDSYEHLIPLDTMGKERLIVGHNVGYDRARIKEEYSLDATKAFFLDTMALHIASSGMCSRQRPKWMQFNKQKKDETTYELAKETEVEDPWVNFSSVNSLAEVANYYCGVTVNKESRDKFSADDIEVIRDHFQELIKYCATDVLTTHKIFCQVFPQFLETCPHPVSFAALKFLGSGVLPTDKSWDSYIESAESVFQQRREEVQQRFVALADSLLKYKDQPEIFTKDPWLCQLDWSVTPMRMKKNGEPYKRQRALPDYPEWYRELYDTKEKAVQITPRTRVVPLLLKLTWEKHPVVWSDYYGWGFKAPATEYFKLKAKNYAYCPEFENLTKDDEIDDNAFKIKEAHLFGLKNQKVSQEEIDRSLIEIFGDHVCFKIPNNAGPLAKSTQLLAKGFAAAFEKGILNSPLEFAREALEMNASCSYWISSRERIRSQFVVPYKDDQKIIIPQVLTMGTVTRRAVEKTWLTASNAKKKRIGSELKSMIRAPPGYSLVGADVDSEELWIASLVGDSMFKLHGGTAIGWMTLEGTKNEGTDLHSKTANILGISRNEAKIFNYGRIYGAGVKFASSLLKQFSPNLTDKQCAELATNLYDSTKGKVERLYPKNAPKLKVWYGGTESILFNALESIAEEDSPRTPVLGAGITSALLKKHLNINSFLPSRINWAIQSSGVDYLHLLCVSMNYLITKYGIDARFCLSVHDEIRFLVKNKDKYRAAMALQISNLWTRGLFCMKLGINDVPQSCAFFSAVDIDHVLRKEVDMDCVTPSNPTPIKPGESLNIQQLLKLSKSRFAKNKKINLPKTDPQEINLSGEHCKKQQGDSNGVYNLDNFDWRNAYLQMQITDSSKELKRLFTSFKKETKTKADNERSADIKPRSEKKDLEMEPKPNSKNTGKSRFANHKKPVTDPQTTSKKNMPRKGFHVNDVDIFFDQPVAKAAVSWSATPQLTARSKSKTVRKI